MWEIKRDWELSKWLTKPLWTLPGELTGKLIVISEWSLSRKSCSVKCWRNIGPSPGPVQALSELAMNRLAVRVVWMDPQSVLVQFVWTLKPWLYGLPIGKPPHHYGQFLTVLPNIYLVASSRNENI